MRGTRTELGASSQITMSRTLAHSLYILERHLSAPDPLKTPTPSTWVTVRIEIAP